MDMKRKRDKGKITNLWGELRSFLFRCKGLMLFLFICSFIALCFCWNQEENGERVLAVEGKGRDDEG